MTNPSRHPADPGALREAVSRIDLFADLDAETLDGLIAAFREFEASAGSDVVREGDSGTDLYIVGRGSLEAVKTSADGEPVRLGELGPGEFFGEMALLTSAPRTATVRVNADALLWSLSRADLATAVRRAPALGTRLREAMRRRQAANALRALQ